MRLSMQNTRAIPWYLKPFFWNQKRKYGQPLEPAKVWASIPSLFLSVASIYGILSRKRSPVPATIRALVSIRVSQMNGCEFCVDLNALALIKQRDHQQKINDLEHWRQSGLFSETEALALHYAEQISDHTACVSDAVFETLKKHFSEGAIIELTALIAFQNMSSKFNSALGIEPQGFCKKT